MTEKAGKIVKNKNKQLKLKKKQKPVESDSEISDSELLDGSPKIDKKQLKKISTEVTDLLASLKKEHGIEDKPDIVTAPQKVKEKTTEKGNKIKKGLKNAAPLVAKKVAKAVVAPIQKPEKKVTAKQPTPKLNENLKQNQVKASDGAKKVVANATIQGEENSPKTKKNKKRATEFVEKSESEDEPEKKKLKQMPIENKKKKKKQKQKQNQAQTKPAVKKEPKEGGDEVDEAKIKKEHQLKTAVPIFVGNLPVNIKRIKLVKMFKKFGKILSIRFRTNTGKTFLRKAQLVKVPYLIAFIYFATPEAAKAATVLSGEKIGDNFITVSLDLDAKEKAANIKPQNTVVVGNLKYAVTEHILRESFKCCGEIEYIRVTQGPLGCKGVAFVCFAKPESCSLALKLNGTLILEREIRVEKYTTKKAEKSIKKEKTAKLLQKKKDKKGIKASATIQQMKTDTDDNEKKKKKKEFLGMKSNDAKKDKVNKKKKKNRLSNEKKLALKVAPKA